VLRVVIVAGDFTCFDNALSLISNQITDHFLAGKFLIGTIAKTILGCLVITMYVLEGHISG
jgi:hypothetical protein